MYIHTTIYVKILFLLFKRLIENENFDFLIYNNLISYIKHKNAIWID